MGDGGITDPKKTKGREIGKGEEGVPQTRSRLTYKVQEKKPKNRAGKGLETCKIKGRNRPGRRVYNSSSHPSSSLLGTCS